MGRFHFLFGSGKQTIPVLCLVREHRQIGWSYDTLGLHVIYFLIFFSSPFHPARWTPSSSRHPRAALGPAPTSLGHRPLPSALGLHRCARFAALGPRVPKQRLSHLGWVCLPFFEGVIFHHVVFSLVGRPLSENQTSSLGEISHLECPYPSNQTQHNDSEGCMYGGIIYKLFVW